MSALRRRSCACMALAPILLVLAAPVAAQRDPADPGAQIPNRAQPALEPPGARKVPERIDPALRFTLRDRDLFEIWAVAEYGRGKCPPGLQKKESACVPRGFPRKRYTVGQPLPGAVVPAPVPLDLSRRIGMPPIGYRYGMIDGDLVKLATGTGLVVDAVDGFIPK